MREHLRGVRARITLVATVVTGVAVLLAGSWLVRTVEDALTDRVRGRAESGLAAVREAIQSGEVPSDADLASLAGELGLQVSFRGRVAAATPGLEGAPPLYQRLPNGDVVVIDPDTGDVLGPERVVVLRQDVASPRGVYQLVATSPYDSVRRGVDAVQEGLLVAFPVLVGAVAVLVWFLTGRALRPVEAIRAEVEAISGSTLDRRVPEPATADEVGRLARTMNAMLDRLEDASSRQQRFVADASHELRSPVAAIRTELEVAQRTADPQDWPAVARRLLAEEARLEAVIGDLLLLASLDEGAASEHVAVDLGELVAEEARRRVPDRDGVTIEVDAAEGVLVDGSRTQLRRAVGNLLDNAGRHARRTVRVTVHRRDRRARILVDDDGPGIPEPDRERAFERFTRLDEHRARVPGSGGAGLGLSLVRRIAERHAGTAAIDTAPLGGARVVVDLPAAGGP